MPGQELRFDGQVAIVTGSGRGMGRAHALELAERGAMVVVNDLAAADGPAEAVAAEINANGGSAVASTADVSEEASARSLVDTALEAFGRIDIVVNNAAIIRRTHFEDLEADVFDRAMKINAYGPYFITRAGWPHFQAQEYGRVVMISSGAALFALPDRVDYGASKAALLGMTRSLASEADGCGIAVNAVFPSAITRMSSEPQRQQYAKRFTMSEAELLEKTPRLVSAMVTCLTHASCSANGEIFEAGEGYYRRILIGSNAGYDDTTATAESVREHLEQVMDPGGFEPRFSYLSRAAWPTGDVLSKASGGAVADRDR